jgi:phage baseplate assembly protein V
MFKPSYSSDGPDSSFENVVRSGTVVDRRVGPNGAEVRVAYPDRGVTSDWLPIGQQNGGGAMTHNCPRNNSNVIVLHLPTGIEQGVVICTTATDNGGALIPDHIDSHVMAFEDGAAFGYNPQSGVLNVIGVNQINVGAGGTVSLYAGGALLLQVSGNVVKTVGGTITISAGGNITITAPQISLNGVLIDSSGNVTIPGTLTVKGITQLQAGGTATPKLTNQDGSGGGS